MAKELSPEQIAKGKECSEKIAAILKEYGFGMSVETTNKPILVPVEPEVVTPEVIKAE